MTTLEARDKLRSQLHSPAMHCTQCNTTRAILDELEQIINAESTDT